MVIFLKQFKNNQSTNMLLDLGCEQTDSKCKNCKVRSTHDSENLGTQKQQQDHFSYLKLNQSYSGHHFIVLKHVKKFN